MTEPFSLDHARVALIVASSADGKITTRDGAGPRFASPRDKELLRRLRSEADAVVLGAGTVANDDPAFRLPSELRAARLARGQSETPIRAVISGRGRVSPQARLFYGHSSPALVFATSAISPERREELSRVATVRVLPEPLNPRDIVSILSREYGARRVLLEGGGEVNFAFLAAGVVGEVYLTLTPYLIGGRDVPTPVGGTGFDFEAIVPLELLTLGVEGSEVYLRYRVLRPSGARETSDTQESVS